MLRTGAKSMQAYVRRPTGQRRRLLLPRAGLTALTALILTLAAGCGSGGSASTDQGPSGPDAPPSSFFGVVPQDELTDADYPEMADAGVKTLRTGLYWTQVQPAGGASFDFSRFDATVKGAAESGITVVPFLYGSPDWVSKGLDHQDCSDCRQYAPSGPGALGAWKLFAGTAAARYGPDGEFWNDNPDLPKMPIHDWQVWNEQNSKTFYRPKPDPASYEKLLRAANEGIRSQDPKATIILGGMFGTPGGGNPKRSVAAATFIHDLLTIDGAKELFDGYALHPYSGSLEFVKKQIEISRRELSKSGYPDASLWITEVGWASGGKKSGLNLGSERAQAQRVTDAYDLFEKHRVEWNLKLVAWFAWQDSHAADDFCFFCTKAGLIDFQGNPKPALDAYRAVATGS